jgi:hypothetical protein
MALDFPTNPTNGQVFGNFYYDSSITAWRNLGSKNALTSSITAVSNSIGLKDIIPTSVVVGSGSATTNANGTVTFSGANKITLNGIFNSTYKNYRVVITSDTAASVTDIYLKFTIAGVDTSSAYYAASWRVDEAATSGARSQSNSTAGIFIGWGDADYNFMLDIYRPNQAKSTNITFNSLGRDSSGSNQSLVGGAQQRSTTQFDGFSINGSTAGGTITVYGYTN